MDDPAEISAADPPRPGLSRESSSPATRRVGALVGKVALITGGDTAIGRAAAVRFAREGADVAFTHLAGHGDAHALVRAVEREGRACLAVCGDVDDPGFCEALVAGVIERFGGVDVLVNNLVARRSPPSFFSLFFLTRRLLPHLRDRSGASIINTASPRPPGDPVRDEEAIRAAIGTCTRSLAHNLARVKVRVNAVVPGEDPELGADDLVFLASDAARSMSGELVDRGAR
ncbi:SDR family NAD(P)-dependent oxidoreductase [Nannocystis punicea]|uniref:SDR family NAD(P)-dependent oxidoreductase n=1 Tax=Nannocystis punicea TaxID=2995304 RepID=A0ABY7H012_9BACT|nr:SDR family NAD(P)-dependent oxidoreductase [Nannocystis poenicansa]WAS92573.1 SDR family NAD(P)-dependent oxidoreductase [Nannocystis poenicansa]